MQEINVFWFRRDLRLEDNAGLYHALKSGKPVLPLFIFDTNILEDLVDKNDARVQFLHDTLTDLKTELEDLGSTLFVKYGTPESIFLELSKSFNIARIFSNRDYEPYALNRDGLIRNQLNKQGVAFETFKDHVVFEQKEVTKDDGLPYTVFTPYSRKWKAKLQSKLALRNKWSHEQHGFSYYLQSYPTEQYFSAFLNIQASVMPSLSSMGFEPSKITIPPKKIAQGLIRKYNETRDFPALQGTSRLGIHFRFGTVSIREKARKASALNETFLNELIWRDFYAMILSNFPHVVQHPFRKKYEAIAWRNNEEEFKHWCAGTTGYPLVDAGMRELNSTGHMHNRVRMVVASFLTKHLLIDWRWGEAYFAQKLLDFDLASNNGGWQWAAGCGTDAAPYFRIFNPTSQLTKFDKELKYTKKWVPEFGTSLYPKPIVEHKMARERCLATYKAGLDLAK